MIFIAQHVQKTRDMLPALCGAYNQMDYIGDIFNYIYKIIADSSMQHQEARLILYRNHYPKFMHNPVEIADDKNMLITIARAIGFDNYAHYQSNRDCPIDHTFESAILHLLNGNATALFSILSQKPEILWQNSLLGHRARLVDYISSNGVEIWRQIVPPNLVDIYAKICQIGYDKSITNTLYGGSSLKGLIETSAHPKTTGITEDLIALNENFAKS